MLRVVAVLAVISLLASPVVALNITDVRDMGWTHVNRGDAASPNFDDETPPTFWDTATATPAGDNNSAVLHTGDKLQWREINSLSGSADGATLFMAWQPGPDLYPKDGPDNPSHHFNVLEIRGAGGVYLTFQGYSDPDTGLTTMWFTDRAIQVKIGTPVTLTTGDWYQWWIQVDTSQNVKVYDVTNAVTGGDADLLWAATVTLSEPPTCITLGNQKAGIGLVTDMAVDEVYFQNSFRAVPEPATLWLAAFGSLMLLRRRR